MRRKIDGATGGPRRRATLAGWVLTALCLLDHNSGPGDSVIEELKTWGAMDPKTGRQIAAAMTGQDQPRGADRLGAGAVEQQTVYRKPVEVIAFQAVAMGAFILELPLQAIDLIADRLRHADKLRRAGGLGAEVAVEARQHVRLRARG